MIGQQIQNYTIVSQLGQGGMGTVYKAVDNVLGREVALKMLNTLMINQPQVLERFKKEAQVLARLLHPNIAVIYNLIEQSQQHFMVMEYVEGKNLDELLRERKTIPYEMVVLIFMQALEGLHHAHKKGIFHRDIKPSNLILTPYGTVKIMDFGIAKVAGEQRMTQVNKVIGTIEFLAPEIIDGKEPSEASDIYATGVTMYELLTGKLPFENSTDYNLMQDILKKKPLALEKLNDAVPKALSNIVMKALEKKPENRFTDAGMFRQALAAAFPELRGLDLTTLNRQLEAAAAAPATQLVNMPRKGINATSMQATRLDSVTRPANILKKLQSGTTMQLQAIQEKYLSTTRSRIVAGSILLLLLLSIGFAVFSNKDKAKENIAGVTIPANDTIIKSENSSTGNIPAQEVVVPVNTPQQDPVNTPVVAPAQVDETDKKKEEQIERDKKEKARKEKEKRDQEKQEQDKLNQPTKPVEPPVQEKKEIYIRSKEVTVSLYLRENAEDMPKRKDIPVSFTVSHPVVVDGVTIIRQGATASGVIRAGITRADITINSVTAANGQTIRLRAAQEHRGIKDLESNRNYSATVLPGTRINF